MRALSRKLLAVASVATFAVSSLAPFPGWTADEHPSARDIMLKAREKQFPANSISDLTMTLISKGGDRRVRKILTKRKEDESGKSMSVAYFLSPADVKGTAFLVWEHTGQPNDVFIYLPALKKIRRIASEQKHERFMGSDFSYADMENADVDEADHRMLAEEEVGGKVCWAVESVPKPTSDSEYSKLVSWVRKEDFIPQKIEFYDKQGKQYKIMEVLKVGPVGDQVLPLQFTMQNVQKEHKTEILLENVQLNQNIPDDEFTHRAIQR
ncbi:MAG: outer membrane lipoprotein-sorting protein [bacterium]